MKDTDDIFKEFQQSIKSLEGNFRVLETNISVKKQMEYFNYSNKVKQKMDLNDLENQIIALNDIHTASEERKYAMTFLAISGDVKAYRALEAYSLQHENEKDEWINMVLLQARITLESEFSDQRQVFISTGLGGKGNKLRFFTLFKANAPDNKFSPYQTELIEKEFPFSLQKYGGEVEELLIEDNYFTLVFLAEIQINIKEMLESALIECNQYGDFISMGFIITNVRKFSAEEIQIEIQKR